MELTSILVFFCFVSATLYAFLLHRFTYWKRRGVPFINPSIIYGNAKGIESKIHHTNFWIDIYQKLKSYGPIGGLYVFFYPVAIVTDLDLIKQILVKDFTNFMDRGHYFDIKHDPISAHLFNIEGDYWRFMRNKLTPAFSSGKLKAMHETFLKLSDKFVATAESTSKSAGSVDIRELSAKFVSDVLGSIGFGIDCNAMTRDDSEYHKIAIHTINNITFFKKSLLEFNRNFFNLIRFSPISDTTRSFYHRMVEELLKFRGTENIQRSDVFNFMITHKDSSRALTKDELAAQSGVFLVAGHETIVTVMSHCLFELSLRKDLQEKARNSVKEALEKFGGEFNYEAVTQMKYIEQCVYESARRYMISLGVRRIATHDYKIPNTNIVIEKGTPIQIPVYAIHHDPEYYPDPYKWNPDRFTPEEVEKRHKAAFLAFGEGPRACIGKRLGIVILMTIISKFILNYELSLDAQKTPLPIRYCPKRLFLTPLDGIHLKLRKIASGE